MGAHEASETAESGVRVTVEARLYFQTLGPWCAADTAAAHLQVASEGLEEMVRRNEILGVEFSDERLYFPTWQFTDTGVLDGFGQVMAVLMPAYAAPEAVAGWFVAIAYEGGFLRHIDELRAGRIEQVVGQAAEDAARLLRQ